MPVVVSQLESVHVALEIPLDLAHLDNVSLHQLNFRLQITKILIAPRVVEISGVSLGSSQGLFHLYQGHLSVIIGYSLL